MLDRRAFLGTGAAALAASGAWASSTVLSERIANLGRPLRILVPNGSQANLAPVIKSFEARYGCPVIQIVTDVDNINATLAIEAITQNDQIDVALPATFGIPDLVEAKAILPLAPLADAWGETEEVSATLYQTGDMFDGQVWGYQTDGDVYMMFYHKDMLRNPDSMKRYEDRYGDALDVPAAWETLDRQMAFFHRPDQGMYGGCLFRTGIYVAWEWWARFHAQGIWPFSPQMEPQIDGEAGVNALEAMIRSSEHLVGSELGLFDNWARFKKGDIFASIGWGGTQKALNATGSAMRGRAIPARLPCFRLEKGYVGMSYFNWGWSYVVTSHSPAPHLAYLFARHAVSKDASSAAVAESEGFFDPFRPEHYENDDIREVYGDAFLDQHRKAMTDALPDLYLARRNEYFEALSYWLTAALAGNVTPQTALQHVANSWRLTTARVGHTAQELRWAALRQRYPAGLRKALQDL